MHSVAGLHTSFRLLQKCSSRAPNQEHSEGAPVKLLEAAWEEKKDAHFVPVVGEDKTNGVSVLKKEKAIQHT